ncbi:Histidine kinase-, DNA gyrase B-, and HSP90-like ATPase [Nonomuraea coxensis DSM 45129]|uniref:Histidine kinase-, DNA gyrase B-, and HSP90-like ATPase n=1 Tax=Nonomuraea coxensis DSM 45129 TaxID=1122611 RepID=A0ABX8U3L4_9ACTN|nr:ATP-binding protein [Nonomuraea coxensis]QYC42260.1 Histidine kinase-, DNA gyrase B-, and HSP90-like ATPase [Nonomuraea coxensis DSM 45129]
MDLLKVDFDEGSLVRARRAVLACARGQGVTGERLGDLLSAVNECLVNAIEHGGGRGRLRLWRETGPGGGRLVCEVADDGDGIPVEVLKRESLPAASAPGGRGIWLTRRLSDEVVFLTGPAGTTVRLVLELAAPVRAARAPVTGSCTE